MAESVARLLQQARLNLQQSSDSPELDAQLLLAHCLDWPRSRVFAYPEHEPNSKQIQQFEHLLQQRQDKVPVAYLIGEQEFWSLSLQVGPDCLVPRPETEDLVAWALEQGSAAAKVLDLGTGSGAIAIALAHERPEWQITATDRSATALQLAQDNAQRHRCRLKFLQGDWFQPVQEQDYDLILSNPPYLADDDPHLGDLPHEPQQALVAGADGLADLQRLAEQAPGFLRDGGQLAMEHGMSQGAAVRELLKQRGFREIATERDLAGLERFTHGRWRAP